MIVCQYQVAVIEGLAKMATFGLVGKRLGVAGG